MKVTLPVLSLLLALILSPLNAESTSEIFSTGPFDAGRSQTNPSVTGNRLFQNGDFGTWWNGTLDTPANVGWNDKGIWWSYALFGSNHRTNSNPEVYNSLVSADEIYFHVGVAWLEVSSGLVGVVDPGVEVGLYFVPGMDVPEGSLGHWDHTWLYLEEFSNKRFKFATINPASVPVMAPTGEIFRSGDPFNNIPAPTEADRINNLVSYDMTAVVKQAINDGLLTADTPWAVVMFPDEALPFVANDSKWFDFRQTVLDGKYMRLETVKTNAPTTWAGYTIEGGFVNTESLLGWIFLAEGDYVYSYDLGRYVYLPESFVSEIGTWMYLSK